MISLKGITIIIIIAGLMAAAVNHNINMPRPDPCDKLKGILETCYEDAGCKLNPGELYRLTNYREMMKELCPDD